jgi:hypothetical protein
MTKLARKWTAEDDAALRDLVEKGVYLRRIALRLRRPESSVLKRAHDMHIKVKSTPRCGYMAMARHDPPRRGPGH